MTPTTPIPTLVVVLAADSGGLVPAWVGILLAAAGCGCGAWLILVGMLPARPHLRTVLAAALAPPSTPGSRGRKPHSSAAGGVDGAGGVGEELRVVRWAVPTARVLHQAGLPGARVTADLRVVGRAPVTHVAIAVTTGLAGFLAPVVLSLPLALVGVGGLPGWLWLLTGCVGFLVPNLRVRGTATRRRGELRRAVVAVLDLTAIALAGGAGVEQALYGAAGVGTGWAHDRIRAVLHAARTTHTDPWTALGRLGAELGVSELSELAATLTLAGTEGARVKSSLTAKAASLRAHQQTGDEATAASATERMSVPVVALFGGYLVFIGYPALAQVLSL